MYYDDQLLLTSGINPHEAFGKLIKTQGSENSYKCIISISKEPNSITDLSRAYSLYPKMKLMSHIEINAF
ncbi:hypothetical protein EBS43_00740 [bacterium]|jgi:hypothetical protein|nr:hypothetical protein [bacterium]